MDNPTMAFVGLCESVRSFPVLVVVKRVRHVVMIPT